MNIKYRHHKLLVLLAIATLVCADKLSAKVEGNLEHPSTFQSSTFSFEATHD